MVSNDNHNSNSKDDNDNDTDNNDNNTVSDDRCGYTCLTMALYMFVCLMQ